MDRFRVKKPDIFSGHRDSIFCLAKMDDHRFFSAGSDGMVILWDLFRPNEGEVIAKVGGSIYALSFDENNHMLYIGENHEGIHKVDMSQKKEAGFVRTGNYQLYDIRISNDMIWVAAGSGELLVFNASFHLINRRQLTSDRLRSLAFNNGEVAIGASDNRIKIMEKASFTPKTELTGHQNSIFSLCYHPSGKYLISGGRDSKLLVWDTSDGYKLRESIAAHLYTINHIVFSGNGKYFVTCSMDRSIKLWNAYNFKLLKVLDRHRHAGHGNSINKLLWMEYQDLLVSCSDDRIVAVWDIKLEA